MKIDLSGPTLWDVAPAPVAAVSSLSYAQGLSEQITRDAQAARDPYISDSERVFFLERMAQYKTEYLRSRS